MKPEAKVFLFGCGGLAVLALAGMVSVGVWLFSGPEGGVKVGNEMEQYALEYIAEHNLLQPGEEVLAYYDATITMDGTEAAILTPNRVIYHKDGNTTSISIQDIEDVSHRYESWLGDIIEIQSASGQLMKIEIAPLNKGETFKNVLMSTWQRTKNEATGG
jgi:hypothetical protein